jgi:hypothetical protein
MAPAGPSLLLHEFGWPESRHAEARHAEARHAEARHAEARHAEARHAEARRAEARHIDGSYTESGALESRASFQHASQVAPPSATPSAPHSAALVDGTLSASPPVGCAPTAAGPASVVGVARGAPHLLNLFLPAFGFVRQTVGSENTALRPQPSAPLPPPPPPISLGGNDDGSDDDSDDGVDADDDDHDGGTRAIRSAPPPARGPALPNLPWLSSS